MSNEVITSTAVGVVETEIHNRVWKIPYVQFGVEKVIDWNHPVWRDNPADGTITVEAINPKRFLDTTLKPFTDQETGIYMGLGSGRYDPNTRKPIFNGYKIASEKTVLKLSDLKERKLALFISLNPQMRNSKNAFSQVLTMLQIKDEVSDTIKSTQHRDLMLKAVEAAKKMDFEEVEGIARITTGVNATDNELMIRSKVEAYAQENPAMFLDKVNNTDKNYEILFKKALDLAVIRNDLNTGYIFGKIPLGRSPYDVVEYLKDTPDVYGTLHREVNATHKKNEEMKKVAEINSTDKNEEMIAMQRKIEALERELAEKKVTDNLNPEPEQEKVEEETANHNMVTVEGFDPAELDTMTYTEMRAFAITKFPKEDLKNVRSEEKLRAFLKENL